MWKAVMLMAAVTIMGTGCSVEPLLNPPVAKELNAATNKALVGKWKASSNNAVYEGDVKLALDEKGKPADGLQIIASSTIDAKSKPLLPMIGSAFKIDNELYITFCADSGKLIDKYKYAGECLWMIRPYFFVAKLTPDGNNFKIEWVNFFEKSKNKAGEDIDVPIDPSARIDGGVVTNSTEELQKLLKGKKYKLQAPILLQRISK